MRVIQCGAAGTRLAQDVDRLAQAQHDRLRQVDLVTRHPLLLLGRAQAHDQDARARLDELRDGGRISGAADLEAHRRADSGDDLAAHLFESLGRPLRGVVTPADQRDRRCIWSACLDQAPRAGGGP